MLSAGRVPFLKEKDNPQIIKPFENGISHLSIVSTKGLLKSSPRIVTVSVKRDSTSLPWKMTGYPFVVPIDLPVLICNFAESDVFDQTPAESKPKMEK
jgi:hypothetical protein